MRAAYLSNGRLALTVDDNYYLRDIYYPYLGKRNHSVGGFFKIGLWHDSKFTWLEGVREKRLNLRNMSLGLEANWDGLRLRAEEAVVSDYPALVRKVEVEGSGYVRVIFYHDFRLNDYEIGDTAFYDPESDAVYHYKGDTWFGVCSTVPLYEFTTGRRDQNSVLPDCEDGVLSKNPIAQGSVASAISVASPKFYYLMAAGQRYEEVRETLARLRKAPEAALRRAWAYWEGVTARFSYDDFARNSLALAMGHIGSNGAVPASLDTDILKFNLDTYAYVWPRDAAFAAMAVDLAGNESATRKFYRFVFSLLSNGYFMQKFSADGTMGSTWHPWTSRGKFSLNIQEDETATVVYAFEKHFELSRDYDLLAEVYEKVEQAADFMTSFRDPNTKLPLESYDLWEEQLGVHTYTVASVAAGLKAASALAKVMGDEDNRAKWETAADEVVSAMTRYLYSESLGRFYKSVRLDEKGVRDPDARAESSTLCVTTFGLLDARDPRVQSNAEEVVKKLWVSPVGGLARYENDLYQRVPLDYGKVPGNPWVITTMWLAEHHLLSGRPEEAEKLLSWAERVKTPTGLLPEQVNPFDGSPLSVVPLLWSHAEYLRAFMMTKGLPGQSVP